MGLFKAITDQVKTKLFGELVADLGTLSTDEHGRQLSLSIRRRSGKRPHLQVKWEGREETDYREIVCSREWAEQFEKVAQEMRRHLD